MKTSVILALFTNNTAQSTHGNVRKSADKTEYATPASYAPKIAVTAFANIENTDRNTPLAMPNLYVIYAASGGINKAIKGDSEVLYTNSCKQISTKKEYIKLLQTLFFCIASSASFKHDNTLYHHKLIIASTKSKFCMNYF